MGTGTRTSAAAGEPTSVRDSFPFREFVHGEATGGVLLLAAAAVALVWANSPWSGSYASLWETKLTIGPDGVALSKSLAHWINDALMAIFFFVVGLEIKRELLVGELASPRQAALPVVAALGGALLPAAIYALLNAGTPGAAGWGVPMATDIAFALGVLALAGDRVPVGLKVFLTALAIVDDLLAVLVIALFYTPGVAWPAVGVALLVLAALAAANRLGVRRPLPYALLGVGLWLAVLESGVHSTIAGVLLAMTIPAGPLLDPAAFLGRARSLLDRFEREGEERGHRHGVEERQGTVRELEAACEAVEFPLQRFERALHPWVAFLIVPLFALANAGVSLAGWGDAVTDRITLGVVLGLLLGKQAGVILGAWLAIRSGLATRPAGVGWSHLWAAAWLAGIGFTMSLFVAGLAFGDGPALATAKIGILAASAIAGIVGWTLLRRATRHDDGAGSPRRAPL